MSGQLARAFELFATAWMGAFVLFGFPAPAITFLGSLLLAVGFDELVSGRLAALQIDSSMLALMMFGE